MLFALSRCQDQAATEIKAEITDVSNLDDFNKDSSKALAENKAYYNSPSITMRPYPLNLGNMSLPIVPLVTPPVIGPTFVKEISETVKFTVTIPPAKHNKLAENYFKTPHRPANAVYLELEHVTIKPIVLPGVQHSGYGLMKEGELPVK
jgi:hypothetical protein